MKRFICHCNKETRKISGVWASSVDFAYVPNNERDYNIGTRAMASRRNPDWDDWVYTLINRYPLQLWWSEIFVPDDATAISVLQDILSRSEHTPGLDEADGYAGYIPEQAILPDLEEYERISDLMWRLDNPILSGLMQEPSDANPIQD